MCRGVLAVSLQMRERAQAEQAPSPAPDGFVPDARPLSGDVRGWSGRGSVPGPGLHMRATQGLADHRQSLAQDQCPRSIRVTIVNSHILQPGAGPAIRRSGTSTRFRRLIDSCLTGGDRLARSLRTAPAFSRCLHLGLHLVRHSQNEGPRRVEPLPMPCPAPVMPASVRQPPRTGALAPGPFAHPS